MSSIQIRRGRNKPYRVCWRDSQSNKQRNKSFRLRKEAQHFLESIGAAENLQVSADPDKIVNDALDRWLWLASTTGLGGREPVEKSTHRKYVYHSDVIRSIIGQVRLAELDEKACEGFRETLLGQQSRKNAKKILTSLKSALNQAVADQVIPFNPAEQVHIRISKRQKMAERVTIPDLSEIHKLTKTIDELMTHENMQLRKSWARYGPLFYTLLYSGLRPTEVRGLPWKSVDWKRGGLKVTQDADELGEIGLLKSGAGYRFVPLPSLVLDMLRDWKEVCPKGKDKLVFPNWEGNVESHGNITKRGWYPLCQRSGLTKLSDAGKTVAKYPLYTLRHVKVALEITSGRSPKKIQEVMGHESIVVTMDTYGHLFKDRESHDDPDEILNLVKSVAQPLPKQSQHIENIQ